MNPRILLEKLIDIEQSIGVETDSTLRRKVLDAQDCLLRMQGELVERLRNHAVESGAGRFALLRAFSLRKAAEEEL